MNKKMMKGLALALVVSMGLGSSPVAFAKTGFKGEYRQGEILSFGSSLNKKEELALRDYFGVSEDMEAIYVDNATAIEQLGLEPHALDDYQGGWYSSAYVKLMDKGGVNVTSKNVSLVTNEMFANALITSGILNCEVNVSAPFMVTGESALAGILAGAEEIMGERLSEDNKVVAKEEIDTTLEIADELLNNTNNDIHSTGDSSTVASGIINDIKQQVIKDSPNSTQIQQIIINVTNNYGVELSAESQEKVLRLMEDVNDLGIEYKDIKETMKNIGNSISENLKEAGIKLKESGFFEKIGHWFSELFENIWGWIKGLFASSETVNEEMSDESNGDSLGEIEMVEEEEPGEVTDLISEIMEQPSDAAVNEGESDEVSSSDSNHGEVSEAFEGDVSTSSENPTTEDEAGQTVSQECVGTEEGDSLEGVEIEEVIGE